MSKRVKFEMEFIIESDPKKLYEYISTDYGLAKWFANKVEAQDNGQVFRCEWDDITVHARIIELKKNQYALFKIEENPGYEEYFELRIVKNNVTDDIALVITDFAIEEEVADYKLLWEGQTKELMYLLENEE